MQKVLPMSTVFAKCKCYIKSMQRLYKFSKVYFHRAPTMVMTMRLDGKTYMCGLSKLLAHELGHLFGSDHDGEDHQINKDSYYWKRGHGDN